MGLAAPAWARLEARLAEWTGIDLGRGGRHQTLERLIEQRARLLGLPSPDAYVDMLRSLDQPEVEQLINVATVGTTWFFRDPEQLDGVGKLLRARAAAGRLTRVWVAGCSTGEEAWSVAMLAAHAGAPIEVLGTDINGEALEHATVARYAPWSARALPGELSPHLPPVAGGRREVASALRPLVRFERQNLLDPPPQPRDRASWDIVLCRNVLIYFDPARAAATAARLAGALHPEGLLLLGAVEANLCSDPSWRWIPLGARFALQRPGGAPTPVPPARPASVPPPPGGHTARELIVRANARHSAGRLNEAIAGYGEALALDPMNAEARMLLGIALYKGDDAHAAANALRAALFVAPSLWPAALYLALSLEKMGRPGEAVEEYRRVVDQDEKPLSLEGGSALLGDLDVWRAEVVALARRRLAALDRPR